MEEYEKLEKNTKRNKDKLIQNMFRQKYRRSYEED